MFKEQEIKIFRFLRLSFSGCLPFFLLYLIFVVHTNFKFCDTLTFYFMNRKALKYV